MGPAEVPSSVELPAKTSQYLALAWGETRKLAAPPADVVAWAIGVPPERSASATTCPGAPTPAGRSSVAVMQAAVPAVTCAGDRRAEGGRALLGQRELLGAVGPPEGEGGGGRQAAGAAETVKVQLELRHDGAGRRRNRPPSAPADSVAAMLMFSGHRDGDLGRGDGGREVQRPRRDREGEGGRDGGPGGGERRIGPARGALTVVEDEQLGSGEVPNWPCASAAPMTTGGERARGCRAVEAPSSRGRLGDVQSSFEPKPSSYIHTKPAPEGREP